MPPSDAVPVADLLPLLPNDYHILFALLDGPLHGYAISRVIHAQTDGHIRLEAANLQRTIQKLIRRGLVDETDWRPAPAEDDGRRRYYVVTPFGKRVLAADARRMRSVVNAARDKKLIPGDRTSR